jgi:hypothetical protein
MFAVIHRGTPPFGAGALPLAGPPLIIRQLQWLRCMGYERVALDIGQDERGERIRQLVTMQRALAHGVVFVHSSQALQPLALGQAAGFPSGVALLALPESVIGNADLGRFHRQAPSQGVRVGRLTPPPTAEALQPAEVHLVTPTAGPVEVEHLSGWGATLDTPGAALRLSREVLLGRLPPADGACPPLLIHAAEQAPGVWVARGGRIQPGAVVRPPVLIEADALVCSGATVGPGAFIGARAIIEEGAVIEQSFVESDTFVGEGLEVRESLASPEGLAPLDGDTPPRPLSDPLLLTRRQRTIPQMLARLLRLAS